MKIKSVLTIAGSDSIGGAGIQADIKTIFSLGLYASSCITAVTAQNTCGVRSIQSINSNILYDQISAVLQDIIPDAIKIGMIYTKENVKAIKNAFKDKNVCPIIILCVSAFDKYVFNSVGVYYIFSAGNHIICTCDFAITKSLCLRNIRCKNVAKREKFLF